MLSGRTLNKAIALQKDIIKNGIYAIDGTGVSIMTDDFVSVVKKHPSQPVRIQKHECGNYLMSAEIKKVTLKTLALESEVEQALDEIPNGIWMSNEVDII